MRERKALYKLRCHKSTNLSEAIAAVRITTNIYSEYAYNIYIQLCSAIGLNSAVSFLPQLTAARSGKFNWSSGIFLFGKFVNNLNSPSTHSTALRFFKDNVSLLCALHLRLSCLFNKQNSVSPHGKKC